VQEPHSIILGRVRHSKCIIALAHFKKDNKHLSHDDAWDNTFIPRGD